MVTCSALWWTFAKYRDEICEASGMDGTRETASFTVENYALIQVNINWVCSIALMLYRRSEGGRRLSFSPCFPFAFIQLLLFILFFVLTKRFGDSKKVERNLAFAFSESFVHLSSSINVCIHFSSTTHWVKGHRTIYPSDGQWAMGQCSGTRTI